MIKKIKFQIVLILLLLTLETSCSKSEASVEAISIEQLLNEPEKDTIKEIVIAEKPKLDGTFVGELNVKLYEKYDLVPHQKRILIDRFTAESVEKTVLISKTDSLVTSDFYMYTFPDSASTKNAFNNWLACFGAKCEEIVVDENKNRVDEQALWCGVFEKSIIVLKFSTEALPFKRELKQSIFQLKSQPLKHTLDVTSNNELLWN